MSDLPYTKEVLRLAAEATGAGRLSPPCVSHTEQNPTCGDRCTVDLRIEDKLIVAFAHDTKACVLTQAAASILGAGLPNHTLADLKDLREAVLGMLSDGSPPGGWFDLYVPLAEVARHPARHRCVLLPIDAALAAASAATEPGRQGP